MVATIHLATVAGLISCSIPSTIDEEALPTKSYYSWLDQLQILIIGTSIYWGYFTVSSQEVSTMALAFSAQNQFLAKSVPGSQHPVVFQCIATHRKFGGCALRSH
jgi:hypothetical protein